MAVPLPAPRVATAVAASAGPRGTRTVLFPPFAGILWTHVFRHENYLRGSPSLTIQLHPWKYNFNYFSHYCFNL